MLWSEEEQQGSADLRRLRHCAVAVVPAGQPLGHRRDEGDTELAHDAEVARREGVVPHEGVHGRRDVDGLAVIPRAHHAREEVVAQPAGDLKPQAELSDEEESGRGGSEEKVPEPCHHHRTLARVLAESGAMTRASAHLRSSMCRTSSPTRLQRDHSSSSV